VHRCSRACQCQQPTVLSPAYAPTTLFDFVIPRTIILGVVQLGPLALCCCDFPLHILRFVPPILGPSRGHACMRQYSCSCCQHQAAVVVVSWSIAFSVVPGTYLEVCVPSSHVGRMRFGLCI
jgi:hypothetical protein